MKRLHKYASYEEYVAAQTEGNKRKLLTHRGVFQAGINWMATLVRERNPVPLFGVCHGTRAGWEQKWFAEALPGCDVWGTEISDTAERFDNTIQWDFHEIEPSWVGAFDFIYSNSYDHAYDPKKAFTNWLKCLDPERGIMLLEHSGGHLPQYVTKLDCFGIELPDLVVMLGECGGKVKVYKDFPFEVPAYIPNLHILAVTR